jgi:signal transduction histidine kinase
LSPADAFDRFYDERVWRPRRRGKLQTAAVIEVGAAAALFAVAVVEVLSAHVWPLTPTVGILFAAAITLPVALSRARPAIAATVVFGAASGQAALARTPQSIAELAALAIVIFASAVRVRARWGWIVALGVLAAVLAVVRSEDDVVLGDYVFTSIVLGTPFVVGLVVRRRIRAIADARRRERRARERRRELASIAVRDERARIARELHDVVAHALSVVVVQAVGGRAVLSLDPQQSVEAFRTIDTTASRALDELHRLVGALQHADAEGGSAPLGLDQLPILVARARASGLDATLHVSGRADPLPPSVELSAYRIVQEALTNALRYAARSEARIEIQHGRGVRVRVSNSAGSGAAAAVLTGSGNGILGMRERAELCGGRLDARRTEDGGFLVDAQLPGGSR